MQICKFYGRTLRGTLARLRSELGEDALVLETRQVAPDSAAARMNPGAMYEVCALRRRTGGPTPQPQAARTGAPKGESKRGYAEHKPAVAPAGGGGSTMLKDLGLLRSQIRELLDETAPEELLLQAHLDLGDYRGLIDQGIDHRIVAPHFRQWLQWRTATPTVRSYLTKQNGPGDRMQGESLREWLWHSWCRAQGLTQAEPGIASAAMESRFVGLLGGTGVGKSTTLAKISSKLRQSKRQNTAIVTLDTHRVGSLDQIRRYAKLIGATLHEVVTQEDLNMSMENWDRFDWVGIDTPGAMNPATVAGELYGSILARNEFVRSLLLLPAAQDEAVSRRQIQQSQPYRIDGLLFGKLDEAIRPGAMVNLTMDGKNRIDSLNTGQRVPDDWHPATADSLWRWVLEPGATPAGVGA